MPLLLWLCRIDGAAIHADAQGTIVLHGHVDEKTNLVLPRSVPLVMAQMARIVANLVDPGGDLGRQSVVLLEIDGEIGRGAAADFGQGFAIACVSTAIRTTPAPAAANWSTWATVASTSAVFVAHMLCTTIGLPPPMMTEPTFTGRVGFR